jgi:glycosyltransferase involved in cell wall biosynthesis
LAHSLPVVATSVGSIPHYLKDAENASLVMPGNSESLARVIQELLHSRDKRQRYIKNGLILARQATLDKQSDVIIDSVHEYLRLTNAYHVRNMQDV